MMSLTERNSLSTNSMSSRPSIKDGILHGMLFVASQVGETGPSSSFSSSLSIPGSAVESAADV